MFSTTHLALLSLGSFIEPGSLKVEQQKSKMEYIYKHTQNVSSLIQTFTLTAQLQKQGLKIAVVSCGLSTFVAVIFKSLKM